MKVAVIVCGNPRSFKRVYPFFKENVVDTLSPDIFIHTWRQTGADNPAVKADGSAEEYVELWNPTRFQIEDLNYNYSHLQTMVPYFTSLWKVNELRKQYASENNFEYDVIIKTRSDIAPLRPIKPEYLLECIENPDIMYVSHFHTGSPSDFLFYSGPKMMDISCDCYFDMDKLHIYQPGGERLWWYRLQKYGYKQSCFRFYSEQLSEDEQGNMVVQPLNLFSTKLIR